MESEQRGEIEQIFEQNEVVWAKIKGYPWWPAFIIEINGQNESGEMGYTVFFFGDNTHSRLGPSKIRKFINKYSEFYQKAKQNRKLKMSIMKAQEKLQQNGQNISIFQTLRNSIRNVKKKKGCQSASKKDSSEHYQLNQSLQLVKNKTHDIKFNRNISQSQINQKNSKLKANSIQEQYQNQQDIAHLSNPLSIEKHHSQIQLPKSTLRRSQRGIKKVQVVPQRQSSSSPSQQKQSKDKSQQQEQYPDRRLIRKKLQDQTQKNQRVRPPFSRLPRGKSKVQQQLINNEPSESSQQEQQEQIVQKPQKKSKPNKVIRKLSKKKEFQKRKTKKIKYLQAHKIKQLSKESNFAQETEMNQLKHQVIYPLQDGQITNQVRIILETLKAIILYKYFPGDGKIKKKYQKTLKKRKVGEKLQTKKIVLSNKSQDLEIRKKTTIKLQNILKPYLHNEAKEYATKIESYFRQRDQLIGQEYKKFAYMILRALKDKISTVDEVISKLQNDQYE